ncbi:MAG: AraC family transcriptional regulator [Clostridiaceae bacterium]|nr:AraC family transcriptional regulator [Clostridiaceae bacterium]
MDEITSNNEQELKQVVSTYEVFLDSTIKAAMVSMEQSDTSPVLTNDYVFFDHQRIYNNLNNIMQLSNFIYSIYYFEKSPEIIYTSAGFSFELDDFYDSEWLETLSLEKDFYLLPARKIPPLSGNEKVVIPVVINLPLNTINHLYTYVLNLDANSLFNYMVKNTATKRERNIKIIDPNGMIIISYNEPDAIFKNIQEFDYIDKKLLLKTPEGSFQTTYNGKRILVSYCESTKYGWKYISEINLDLVTNNMYRPITIMLYISVMLLVLSFAASISVSKRLYKPVRELVNLIGCKSDRAEEDEYELIGKYLNEYLNENRHLKTEASKNMKIMEKLFLTNLIAKDIYNPDEIAEKFSYFGIPSSDNYTVLAIEVDDMEYVNTLVPNDKMLFDYAIEDISMRLLSKYGIGFFVSIESGKYAIAFSQKPEMKSDTQKITVKLATELKENISETLRLTVSIGIGKTVDNAGEINKSYCEASKALTLREIFGDGEVILYEELANNSILTINYPEDLDETLVQHVTAGEADKAELILKEIFAVLRKQKYIQRSHIYMFSLQLLNTLIKLMVELEIPENEIFVNAGGFGALCSKLMQVRKETECVTVFCEVVSKICEKVNEKRSNTSNEKVKEIIDYINNNFNKPISVDIIADEVQLNSCYLGRLFKQYTNLSIVDYINQIRINNALELLTKTDMKIFEIADAVGFNNTHYFIKIFKKQMNMTPGQYREQYVK